MHLTRDSIRVPCFYDKNELIWDTDYTAASQLLLSSDSITCTTSSLDGCRARDVCDSGGEGDAYISHMLAVIVFRYIHNTR